MLVVNERRTVQVVIGIDLSKTIRHRDESKRKDAKHVFPAAASNQEFNSSGLLTPI